MTEGSASVHGPHLEITRWFPTEVAAGAELTVTVRVNCPFGCDLRGMEVVVEAPEGPVVTEKLVSWEEGSNATAEKPGCCDWIHVAHSADECNLVSVAALARCP